MVHLGTDKDPKVKKQKLTHMVEGKVKVLGLSLEAQCMLLKKKMKLKMNLMNTKL